MGRSLERMKELWEDYDKNIKKYDGGGVSLNILHEETRGLLTDKIASIEILSDYHGFLSD